MRSSKTSAHEDSSLPRSWPVLGEGMDMKGLA